MQEIFHFSSIDHIDFAGHLFELTGFNPQKKTSVTEEITARGGAAGLGVETADYLVVQENYPSPTSTYRKALARLNDSEDGAIQIIASSQLEYYLKKVPPLSEQACSNALEQARQMKITREDGIKRRKELKAQQKALASQRVVKRAKSELQQQEAQLQREKKHALLQKQRFEKKHSLLSSSGIRSEPDDRSAVSIPRRMEGFVEVDIESSIDCSGNNFMIRGIRNPEEEAAMKAYITEHGGVLQPKISSELTYLILDTEINREIDAYHQAQRLREFSDRPRIITVDRFYRLTGLYRTRAQVTRTLNVHAQEMKRHLLAYAEDQAEPEKADIRQLVNSMTADDLEDFAKEKGLYDPMVSSAWDKGPYAFISHKHENKTSVKQILRQFKADGFLFWYDEGLVPGTDWHQNVIMRLNGSALFLSMVSEDYWKSPFCLEELRTAAAQGKPIVFVHMDQDGIPAEFAELAANCRNITYRPDDPALYRELYPLMGNLHPGTV